MNAEQQAKLDAFDQIKSCLEKGATIRAVDPKKVLVYLGEDKMYGGLHISNSWSMGILGAAEAASGE